MPYSYAVYTGNGSTTQFTVPFPYIRKEHVKVYVNYVDTAYTYVNNTTVQLASAPANGLRVEVRRVTPAALPLVDYTDGSTLVAADLDTSNLQHLYLEQELDDALKQSIAIDATTGLPTAGNQRITNVADPVNAQDAATKNYVDTQDNLRLKRDGTQAMTGALPMGGFKVTGLGAPSALTDAATKSYVDSTVVAATIPDGDYGDITVSGSATTWTLDSGTITDAKIASGAAIAHTKLASIAAGSVLMGNSSGVPTATTFTGDVTINSSGVTAIGSGVIVNGDINASAAIAGTKINPDFGSQAVTTTDVFKAALGTANAPSITFTGDLNTGLYSPGADQLAFSTGGTGRLFIDSAGRVGIGTASPGYLLDVATSEIRLNNTAGTGAKISFWDTTTQSAIGTNAGSLVFYNSGGSTERARIDSLGRLLVGTSSARSNLFNSSSIASNIFQVEKAADSAGISIVTNNDTGATAYLALCRSKGTTLNSNTLVASGDILGTLTFQGNDGTEFVDGARIEAFVDGLSGANDLPARLVFSTTADGASSPTERMRITSAGDLCLGTTSTSYGERLAVSKSSGSAPVASFFNTTGSGNQACLDTSLNSTANNTSSYHLRATTQTVANWYLYGNGTSSFTSDARKKKNIETTRDGYLEDLSRLRVVKYNWFNQDDSEPKELGLIAQEVEQVFPGLVQEADKLEGDDFNCKVLKGSVLPFMLLKALQEAHAKIGTLEAKVAALEAA